MKKDKKTEEFLKKMENFKLSDASRTRIEKNLLNYARFHGVRDKEGGRSIGQVPKSTSLFIRIFNSKKSMTGAIIAILLVAGGGTSFAAEGAVPGEFLYPVKTEVNESVRSTFAFSNEAETRLQAQLAEERLEEASELAARGELTAETAADISSRVRAHYTEAEKRGSNAEANGNYEASASARASLEGSFRTYADTLTNLDAQVSGNNGATLIADLRTYADSVAESQTQASTRIEGSANAQVAAETTVERAEEIIAEVEARLNRAESRLSAEARAQVEAKLSEAASAHAEAKTSLGSEAHNRAYTNARAAMRIASEARAMVNSALQLRTGVNANVDGGIEVDTDSESGTETETDSTESEEEADGSQDTDASIEAEGEANAETNGSDTEAETEGSVESELNL